MKKFIMLLAALAFIACSSDDSKPKEEPEETGPEKKLYPETAYFEDEEGITSFAFEYNSQKQLVSIDSNLDLLDVEISYEGGRVKHVAYDGKDIVVIYEDDIIKFLEIDGEVTDVDYNEAQDKYVFEGLQQSIRLNSQQDIMEEGYLFAGSEYLVVYGFDDAKKGPIYNYGTENNFIVAAISGIGIIYSARPVTFYDDMDVENTYNSEGFVTKAVYGDNGEMTIDYTYTKL